MTIRNHVKGNIFRGYLNFHPDGSVTETPRLAGAILRILAYFRLNDGAICSMSAGGKDYHDYPDGTVKDPMHFHTYTCERCGKPFTI